MREQLLDFLKRELIGPDPVSPYIQDNGEEILSDPPSHRYGAGILFPSGITIREKEEDEAKDTTIHNVYLENPVNDYV
ncbi:MAG: hypothetical protein ABRQ39_31930 [Candidatus Eremiobacterota bacterium]